MTDRATRGAALARRVMAGALVALLVMLAGMMWPRRGHQAVQCRLPGVEESARCLSVDVPETPLDPASRRLGIHVMVLPGRPAGPRREPLVLIQGGPGVPGTLMARTFARREELRQGRDLVLFDQRGTGGSALLTCAHLGRFNFLGALFPPHHVRACRGANARQADLDSYTNATSAEDLEAIRKALGVESWSLAGYSFGTRLAQAYARRYPQRVRAVVLDGVVPFDAELTSDLAPAMERSLDYVVSRCERDDACRRRYPDTRAAIRRLAERLGNSTVDIAVTDSTGQTLTGKFGRWDFTYAVRGMLYGQLAAAIPAWVHEAERTKDFSDFARVYWQRSRWVGDSTSLALHLGVYCSEDLPFTDSARAVRIAHGTFMGDRYFLEYRAGCREWPMPRAAMEMRQPWRSDIPSLLLSGERDPVTPPEYGERVVRHLSRARHIVIPGGGHAEQGACKTHVVAAFLNDPARAVTTTCLDLLDFPPFLIAR